MTWSIWWIIVLLTAILLHNPMFVLAMAITAAVCQLVFFVPDLFRIWFAFASQPVKDEPWTTKRTVCAVIIFGPTVLHLVGWTH
jgi:hypothetical protein